MSIESNIAATPLMQTAKYPGYCETITWREWEFKYVGAKVNPGKTPLWEKILLAFCRFICSDGEGSVNVFDKYAGLTPVAANRIRVLDNPDPRYYFIEHSFCDYGAVTIDPYGRI
jgi:hypothetical protein